MHVQVKSHIALKTAFVVGEHAKEIKVMYLVIDNPYSYYIIIGGPTLKEFGDTLLTLYL